MWRSQVGWRWGFLAIAYLNFSMVALLLFFSPLIFEYFINYWIRFRGSRVFAHIFFSKCYYKCEQIVFFLQLLYFKINFYWFLFKKIIFVDVIVQRDGGGGGGGDGDKGIHLPK